MISSAPITARNDNALIQYTIATSRTPISSPAIIGPTMVATSNMIEFRLSALARCSRGTRLGISACRAGLSNADALAASALSR